MSRLSNNIRENMAAALVQHRFAERAAGLIAESQKLLHLAYEAHYDAKTRDHMKAIRKSISAAFETRDELRVNVGGQAFEVGHHMIGTGGRAYWWPECEKLPVLHDLGGYRSTIGIDADHPLAARLLAFAQQREAIKEEAELAYREALGALNQFATGKRLAEDWPEAMPVIGHLIPEDNRTLPIVQVSKLNSSFGLPPA